MIYVKIGQGRAGQGRVESYFKRKMVEKIKSKKGEVEVGMAAGGIRHYKR